MNNISSSTNTTDYMIASTKMLQHTHIHTFRELKLPSRENKKRKKAYHWRWKILFFPCKYKKKLKQKSARVLSIPWNLYDAPHLRHDTYEVPRKIRKAVQVRINCSEWNTANESDQHTARSVWVKGQFHSLQYSLGSGVTRYLADFSAFYSVL